MHLVNPKQYQRMDHMMTPIQRTISRLDEEMENILRRSDINDSEKITLYNQVLQRYLEYQERPKQDTPPTPIAKDLKEEIFMTVPVNLKRKAEALLTRVQNDPNITWNERGEFIYQGQIVPGSNMTDLINDALRQRKTFQPHGWRDFARALRHSNVPQDLVGHRQRWDWMHRESATSDAFSTAEESPGEEEEDEENRGRNRTRSQLKTPTRSSVPERKQSAVKKSTKKTTAKKKINWMNYK